MTKRPCAASLVARTEFSALLVSFEQALQLGQPSDLGGPALSAVILLKTDGIIGEIGTLLARAAIHATQTGAERIERHVVDACGHQSPSDVDRWNEHPYFFGARRMIRRRAA